MKVQFFNGGLANQAFQYIFARYYELSHPGEIMYLDDSYFSLYTVHNGYELEKVFGIKPHFLSECFEQDVWNYILEEKVNGKSVPQILCENGIHMYMLSEVGEGYQHFNPFDGKVTLIPTNTYEPMIQDAPGDVYYHGYWLNKEWFEKYKENFLNEFRFPEIEDEKNKSYQYQIQNSHSVSLHVRRGDYVTLDMAMEAIHYSNLVKKFALGLQENPELEQDIKEWKVFVFSDDINWCKDKQREIGLDVFGEIVFVKGNTDGKNYIDLQLMSLCEGMILSNSAFCYLAALLNIRRKIAVNPTKRRL